MYAAKTNRKVLRSNCSVHERKDCGYMSDYQMTEELRLEDVMKLIDADELMERVRNTITEQSGAMDWINLIASMPEVDPLLEMYKKRETAPVDSISWQDYYTRRYGKVE